jgi:exonuclease III
VVGTVGSCDERIGGVIMVPSVVESRNRDDQGSITANSRVRANARATNYTAINKGEADDIASIRIGTYNIRNGRAWNLEGGLRAMNKMNMDIVLLTETKLRNAQHTKKAFGYDVVATKERSKAQGGVALIYRESEYWTVESVKRFGSDVISFQLATGQKWYSCVGGYTPPNDESIIESICKAFDSFPKGPRILLGDLNVNLNNPRNDHGLQIATMVADLGLEDLISHLNQKCNYREKFTWWMRRGNSIIKAKCDYILGSDRGLFTKIAIHNPRHYSSDHYMVMGTIASRPKRENRSFSRSRKSFTLKRDKITPINKADSIFDEIKSFVEKDARTTRRWLSWISPETWKLVDSRAALRRHGKTQCSEGRKLLRKISKGIKADRKERTKKAGESIEILLETCNLKGAWRSLQAWYKHASGKGSKPSHADLESTSAEFQALYTQKTPPGDPIPICVAPFEIDDNVSDERKIADIVSLLRWGNPLGPSGIRAEHLREWLNAAEQEIKPDPRRCTKMVELDQNAFETGELPTELPWSVLVLIPKGSGGCRMIGLLEICWKVISKIMDFRMKQGIGFDDSIHGFRAERGTSTANIEAKLQMQLSCARRHTLCQVFINLAKAYDTLDRGQTLEILEGYGLGKRILHLLNNFWDSLLVVARQGGYHSSAFPEDRGVTQGDIPSPTIFNIVCDAIIRAWKVGVTYGHITSSDGEGAINEEITAMLYANDGLLASNQPDILQGGTDYLVDLLQRVGLNANTSKTKSMTCEPRPEQGPISDHAYKRRMTGYGFSYKTRQRRKVTFPTCDKEMTAGYLARHQRKIHGYSGMEVEPPITASIVRRQDIYNVSFPSWNDYIVCPVEGCTGRATTCGSLRRHFMFKHPHHCITILEEGPLPRCARCDMHLPATALERGHGATLLCRQGHVLKLKRAAEENIRRAREVVFSVRGASYR